MRIASTEAWRRFASCRRVRADLAATATTQIRPTGKQDREDGEDRSGQATRPHRLGIGPGEAEERHGQEPDQRQDTGDDFDDRDPRLRLRARIEPEFER
jgi:hypothetical protein